MFQIMQGDVIDEGLGPYNTGNPRDENNEDPYTPDPIQPHRELEQEKEEEETEEVESIQPQLRQSDRPVKNVMIILMTISF